MKNKAFALLLWIPCCLLLLSAKQDLPPDIPISQEYCQDYDYLVQTLKDNYPYWSLAERQSDSRNGTTFCLPGGRHPCE